MSSEISRQLGADIDTGRAWEMIRREQAKANASGLREVAKHYDIDLCTITNREAAGLTRVAMRVLLASPDASFPTPCAPSRASARDRHRVPAVDAEQYEAPS